MLSRSGQNWTLTQPFGPCRPPLRARSMTRRNLSRSSSDERRPQWLRSLHARVLYRWKTVKGSHLRKSHLSKASLVMGGLWSSVFNYRRNNRTRLSKAPQKKRFHALARSRHGTRPQTARTRSGISPSVNCLRPSSCASPSER